MLPPHDPPTPAQPVRSARPPGTQRAREAAQPKRRRGRRLGRTLLVLALLLAVGAGAGVYIADQMSAKPNLRRVTEQNAQRAIDDVKRFIEENTR
jgi:cytochrome c-type biogenesis protein CcmH/NrfG